MAVNIGAGMAVSIVKKVTIQMTKPEFASDTRQYATWIGHTTVHQVNG